MSHINRSPSNPAGTFVTYCSDCDVGPGGVYQNCGERYIQMFEVDPNTPPTNPPFKERIPPGVIEKAQPLTQQNPTGVDENVPSEQGFTEQLSSSDNSVMMVQGTTNRITTIMKNLMKTVM